MTPRLLFGHSTQLIAQGYPSHHIGFELLSSAVGSISDTNYRMLFPYLSYSLTIIQNIFRIKV
jgi:hypothetical protein